MIKKVRVETLIDDSTALISQRIYVFGLLLIEDSFISTSNAVLSQFSSEEQISSDLYHNTNIGFVKAPEE